MWLIGLRLCRFEWFITILLVTWIDGGYPEANRRVYHPDASSTHSPLIINHHYPNYNQHNQHYSRNQSTYHLHHHNQPPQDPTRSVYNSITDQHRQWTSGSMNNVTASVGRNATFECVFPNLKQDFRLAWFHKDRHTVLAMHDSVVAKNGRTSVRSHANTTFYLTIHDIREEDRGFYMCQVNTIPMRSQTGYLEVNVPPQFIEEDTSSDMDVREFSSANFHCRARGRPQPDIWWRREDGQLLDIQSQKSKELKGEYLSISNVSRHHMAAYLCIASNGIPPTISKRMFLGVSFPPVIWTNKESIGISVKSSVALECHLEAYPRPTVYWNKDDQMPPIIHSDKKYEITIKESTIPYRFVVRLKIHDVQKADYGKYTCLAKNMLGEVNASIQLYEIERKKIQQYNSRSRNIFLDFFQTTSKPIVVTKQAFEYNRPNRVTEDSEKATTEAFDYETNYLSPEMNNDLMKEEGNGGGGGSKPSYFIICLYNTILLIFHAIH